jgi:hypothetical protein
MNLDGAFVRTIMRICGEFAITSTEADAICTLLGTRDEFLAWLLLRKNLAAKHRDIGEALVESAAAGVVDFATPRKESAFPIFEREDRLALEKSLKALVAASDSSLPVTADVTAALTSIASRRPGEATTGQSPGVAAMRDDA